MKNQHGFTLIELLVVVLIIGILTAVALPQYTTAVEKSRAAEALTLMSSMVGSIERYRLQKDAWPADNAFTKLDVEIPQIEGTSSYGGENFIMTFNSSEDSDTKFIVTATRRLNDTNQQYKLETEITEASNGTFSITRTCSPTNSTNPDAAVKFCDAVTNGHPNGF